jgi:hypothetical protein
MMFTYLGMMFASLGMMFASLGMMFTCLLHPVPRVRMSGAEPLLSLYAFMGSTGQLYFPPFHTRIKTLP